MPDVASWENGDGDGPEISEYEDAYQTNSGWKLYDSYADLTENKLPPKNVHLDDHTVGKLMRMAMKRQIPWKTLAQWHADFDKDGMVRSSRPNKGNPYIGETEGRPVCGEIASHTGVAILPYYVLKGATTVGSPLTGGTKPTIETVEIISADGWLLAKDTPRHPMTRIDYWRIEDITVRNLSDSHYEQYQAFMTSQWVGNRPIHMMSNQIGPIPLSVFKQRILREKFDLDTCSEREHLLLTVIKNMEAFLPPCFPDMYRFKALTNGRRMDDRASVKERRFMLHYDEALPAWDVDDEGSTTPGPDDERRFSERGRTASSLTALDGW